METEVITYRRWDSYAKRIERKKLKERGKSLTFTGIERRANDYIVEVRPDEKTMVVKKGWREAMKKEEEKDNKGVNVSPCNDSFCRGGTDTTTGMKCMTCDGNGVVVDEK